MPSVNRIIYAGKHLLTYTVPRHSHASWEFIYCTGGEGVISANEFSLPYQADDVVLIPPLTPHVNESRDGFTNVHVNVVDSTLNVPVPTVVHADGTGFLLNAFNAAFFHYSDPSSRNTPLLDAYGELIVRYLSAYQSAPDHSSVVRKIEDHIIRNYPDCDFELDGYLRSLPFSYDYLRKLFKREIGVTPPPLPQRQAAGNRGVLPARRRGAHHRGDRASVRLPGAAVFLSDVQEEIRRLPLCLRPLAPARGTGPGFGQHQDPAVSLIPDA